MVRASLYDVRAATRLREFSGRYVAGDIPRLSQAFGGMTAAALHAHPPPLATRPHPEVKRLFDSGISHVRRSLEGADAAIADFERAAKIDPESAWPSAGLTEAWCSKFQLTRKEQWLDKARESLAHAELRDPDNPAVRLASARLNRLLAMYESAIADYVRVTELDSSNPQPYVGLAITYLSAQRPLDSINAFNRALELKPDYFLAHLELGHLYHRQALHQAAWKHLTRASELSPKSSKVHSSLGALYVDMARYAEAEATLRKSIDLEPSEAAEIDLGAALAMQHRDEEAIVWYLQALKRGSTSTVLLVNLGDSYRRTRQSHKAQKAWSQGLAATRKALLANPYDAGARAYSGYLCSRLGDRIEGEQQTLQALQFAPSDAKVKRRVILTLELLGRRDQVIELLRTARPDMLKEIHAHPDLDNLRADPRYRTIHESVANKETQ